MAADIQPRIFASAMRRLTMAILLQSDAGITLVPDALANVIIDGIVTRSLSSSEQQMCVAATYLKGDLQGFVAQFLCIATATASSF